MIVINIPWTFLFHIRKLNSSKNINTFKVFTMRWFEMNIQIIFSVYLFHKSTHRQHTLPIPVLNEGLGGKIPNPLSPFIHRGDIGFYSFLKKRKIYQFHINLIKIASCLRRPHALIIQWIWKIFSLISYNTSLVFKYI